MVEPITAQETIFNASLKLYNNKKSKNFIIEYCHNPWWLDQSQLTNKHRDCHNHEIIMLMTIMIVTMDDDDDDDDAGGYQC